MSNTESLCNEGIDSVVTDTTRDTDEQVTPKILCGLQGLGQKPEPEIISPRWKAKLAPSVASTSQTSPVVPFQVAQKLKSSDTGGNSRQDSCSETMSPSILPQTDRWTESFSIIPSFVKKRDKTQIFESQSQSLLPQTNRQMEKMTLQPSFTKSSSSGAATGSSAKSWGRTDETAGTTQQATKPSKTEKSKKKKSSERAPKKKSLQNSNNSEKQQKKKKSSASSGGCSSLKSLAKAAMQTKTSKTSEPKAKTSLHKKRPSSLTIPTQSSLKSSSETDDVTTKISERIEKQLADLEQAPRRKMLVIEAALVHCVTSVQDNIENKLVKLNRSFKMENAETLRKLLQTLKTTLGRLIEHHKQEREQFGSVVRASQSTQEETLVQKTLLLELGKRQKKVFSLFTKQRELTTKLKEIETAKNSAVKDKTSAELLGIAENIGKETVRKDVNENEIIENTLHWKQGERNDVVVNIIDETEAVKDVRSERHNVPSIQETVKSSQSAHSEISNTPSLFKSRSGVVQSQVSPQSGSGLMDMLKLFGSRKRQVSVNDAGSNTQLSSASAFAADMTVESSARVESASFSDAENRIDTNSDRSSLDKHFLRGKANSAKHQNEIKHIRKHSDLQEEHLKEMHNKHYGPNDKEDAETKLISNKTPEKVIHRNENEIGGKVTMKEVDAVVEIHTERQVSGRDKYTKEMRESKTKGEDSVENVESFEEKETEIQSSREENLDELNLSKRNVKEHITCKKVQNTSESETSVEPRVKGSVGKQVKGRKAGERAMDKFKHSRAELTEKEELNHSPSSKGTDTGLQTNFKEIDYHRTSVNDNENNNESFPQAFEPRRFYKQASKETTKPLPSSKAVDIAGCVIDKEEDVLLSQDVTTIPDTQEPSTQDTWNGEQVAEQKVTRNKRKQSISSDEKAPSRKKYTKMQEADERQKVDRTVCSPKAQESAIQETAGPDERAAKMITRDIEKMPLVQSVDVVSLNNSVNHVSQIDGGKESASQRVRCESDITLANKKDKFPNELGLPNFTSGIMNTSKSNDSSVKPFSERLWVDMMRKEPHSNKPTGKSFEIVDYKDQGLVSSLKSPGVKLDRVIKRITEEKENLTKEKEKLKNDSNSPYSANSKSKVIPAQVRNLDLDKTSLQALENKERAEKNVDPIMSSKSLHDAGLAVELPKPKGQPNHLLGYQSVIISNHHPMFSPPRVPPQDEPYTDISPTATSMSSDVFVVKAKELEKRMKRRVEMAQKHSMTNSKQSVPPKNVIPTKLESSSNNKVNKPETFQIPNHSTGNWISIFPNQNSIKQPASFPMIQNQSVEARKTVKAKTSEEKLEAVINDVIKSSSAAVDDYSQKQISQTDMPGQQITADNTYSQALKSASSANFSKVANNPQYNQVSGPFTTDIQRQKSGQSVKIVYPRHVLQQENSISMAGNVSTPAAKTSVDLLGSKPPLPFLKSLVKMGILRPGTNVLSTEVKGRNFWATLTPLGMIKTANGQIFKTPMQWLSTLQGDGSLVKRRKSYEKIMYNGLPLLSYCSTTVEPPEDYSGEQSTKSQERSEVTEINWEETAEGRLNKFLSTCRIRLLRKIDLISCYDLPDNFWANNFADVKLPSDIWGCVDAWD